MCFDSTSKWEPISNDWHERHFLARWSPWWYLASLPSFTGGKRRLWEGSWFPTPHSYTKNLCCLAQIWVFFPKLHIDPLSRMTSLSVDFSAINYLQKKTFSSSEPFLVLFLNVPQTLIERSIVHHCCWPCLLFIWGFCTDFDFLNMSFKYYLPWLLSFGCLPPSICVWDECFVCLASS